MTKASFFRLAAIAVLLLTGAELFACELLAPAQCESFGYPQDGPGRGDDDKCICCCTHILVTGIARLEAAAEVVSFIEPESVEKAERKSASIDHPPRS